MGGPETTMSTDHTNFVFTLLRDIYGLRDEDISSLDPATLSEKVKRVHQGLSAEHEFAAIASWLGKCTLLSQLDDVLHSSGKYRAPDFLVVASYEGREVPFLVEVKSGSKRQPQVDREIYRVPVGIRRSHEASIACRMEKAWAVGSSRLQPLCKKAHGLSSNFR